MKYPPPDRSFLHCYPEIASEWNYERNEFRPEQYYPHSRKKVWWKCTACGFEWESEISNRTSGRSCPVCAHQKVWSGHNDLKALFPDLAKEWDNEKNAVSADQVFPNTAKKYWWKCDKGHSFLESPNTRVNMKTGCPICSGHRLAKGINDLKTLFPEVAAEWDVEKNEKAPDEVTPHTHTYAWWICPKGHSYRAQVSNRTAERGTNCPFCAGRSVLVGFNDLASQYPEIARQWHPEKNLPLMPEDVTSASNKSVWWLCPVCGNEWKTTVAARTGPKTTCPRCKRWFHTSKIEQILFYYIKSVFPDAENGYMLNAKNEIDVFIPSRKIGIEYDGQRWHGEAKKANDEYKGRAIIASQIRLFRIREPNCAVINDGSTIIFTSTPKGDFTHINDALIELFSILAEENICHSVPEIDIDRDNVKIAASFSQNAAERSLASIAPNLVEEWDFEKNYGLKPDCIPAYSAIKAWWICRECGNNWRAGIYSRVNGRGCPLCKSAKLSKAARKRHFLPGINDLVTVAPDVAKEWDYTRNKEIPVNVTHGSPAKYWWICPQGHSYEASVANRVKGRGCPFCYKERRGTLAKKARLHPGINDLVSAAPDIAKEWDYSKNSEIPEKVTRGSGIKYWWVCPKGHSYEATPSHRSRGQGCPYCSGRRKLST